MISTHGTGLTEAAISGHHRYAEGNADPRRLVGRTTDAYRPHVYPATLLGPRPDVWPFDTRGAVARAIRAEAGIVLARRRRVGR